LIDNAVNAMRTATGEEPGRRANGHANCASAAPDGDAAGDDTSHTPSAALAFDAFADFRKSREHLDISCAI
jgi:hypothetical protein